MQSPHDLSSGLDAARRLIHAGAGFGWAAGALLLLGLFLTDAPAWAHVLALGVWGQGMWLVRIWQDHALAAATLAVPAPLTLPVVQDTHTPTEPPGASESWRESPPESPPASAQETPAQALSESKLDAEGEVQRDVEQDMLRYALSHDLRAPLRVIDGFTRIVKEDYGRHLDRLGQDHLDRVLTASARMNGMIDAVLAQAQLAGACLAREEVDLSALAREVGAELLALQTDGPPVQLQVADGLHAQADALLIRRVLENLLGNAIKYSAKVAQPRVELGCMPATNPQVYFVRDNGAGFDMQHADKLFGMFQRLHSAKDFPGTGVGLAGVRNIVRRHGGRVWAEAQPGQGACFYFTLIGTAEAQRSSAG